MWDRREIDERVEASCGEVGPDRTWPVVITSRESGDVMVTFQIREVDGHLDGTYTTASAEFHDPLVSAIFVQAYLATFCDHSYAGRITRITLRRADGAAVHELAYPRWLDPETIDDELEAGEGEADADGWSPASIFRRGTHEDVIGLRIRAQHDWMDVTYTVLDPSLSNHDVKEIFIQAYLYTLTGGHYADQLSTIRLRRDDDSMLMSFRYPRPTS